jgi:hypothetical protein
MLADLKSEQEELGPEYLCLKHNVQEELFLMSGGLHPTLDVTSYSETSSLCPRKLSVEDGLETDLAGARIYAHPGRHDISNVLEHYWECKARAPTETSGIFVIPNKACPALMLRGYLNGMELLKTYQRGDRVLMPTPQRANPATALQVWYDPPDIELPPVATRSWRDNNTGEGSVFRLVRSDQVRRDPEQEEAGVEDETQVEIYPGPADNEVRPHPAGPRFGPHKWEGRGRWKKSNGHLWRPATDPKLRMIQEIARKKTKYNRGKQHHLQTVQTQTKKHGRILMADEQSLTDMLFSGRLGPR